MMNMRFFLLFLTMCSSLACLSFGYTMVRRPSSLEIASGLYFELFLPQRNALVNEHTANHPWLC